ncbi:hypothetical protein B0J18DRAFT_416893 [Chaetomium sp. MPI-SDFR-AT-0129]|nr:hypothetical protein B0J18DRAFT_416893 [Chaetomium sp. MPI-SDFR-AT-0129]
MLYRAIRPKISTFTTRFRYLKRISLPYGVAYHHPISSIKFSSSSNNPPTSNPNSTPGNKTNNTAPHNTHPINTPIPMAKAQLTDADRARVQARNDAMSKALGTIEPYDPDRVREALLAVARDHPVDDALREAYADELLRGMAASEPLDNLERALACPLLAPGAPWGLAVYRVAYSGGEGADEAWRRMVELIRDSVREDLDMRGRLDLWPRHRLVVVDDRDRFDGASPDRVREDFVKWAREEFRRNQREEPVMEDEMARLYPTGPLEEWAGTRYNFCLVVDDICLESLEHMSDPVVKLVRKDWAPYEPELGEDEDYGDNPGWEGGVSNNEFEDVGWMYMNLSDYVDIQNSLDDPHDWEDDYVRPPLMRWRDDFEKTAPGFWRRGGKSDGE